jgi:signal transduction histidine kinase
LRKTSDYASNILSKDNKLMDDSKIKEIRDIQDTLYNLSVRLKLKNRIRKEKADKLIHEARTPITILRTNVEGILDGIVEPDEDRLQTCIKELENLTNIVENIDDVLEEKEVDIEVKEFNLSQEIDKIIKGMELQFKSKNIEIFKNIQEDILIKSDRGIINQSLYNLLSNAYKYTKEKGKVRITLEKKDNIIIKVEDNGEGISKKDEDRIFEPYYRGGTKNQEGEGLGLYITRTNLLKINGEISVTQSELGGAEFTIKL